MIALISHLVTLVSFLGNIQEKDELLEDFDRERLQMA